MTGGRFWEDRPLEALDRAQWEALCDGCGKCVNGCKDFGNGSLYLQIDQNLCVNCNECSIARSCPSDAISRISDKVQYIPKEKI